MHPQSTPRKRLGRPSTQVERTCEWCGATFTVIAYRIRKGQVKYCSMPCRRDAFRNRVPDLFWPQVDKSKECWIWTGATKGPKHASYGRYHRDGAHRVAWKLTYGPIPDGMYVCHHCDNKLCVRPDHLFLGTQFDNMGDAKRKGRTPRGERHGRSKLTEDQVREILAFYATNPGVSRRVTAEQYGVTRTAIDQIIQRKTWRHLEG